MSLSCIFSYFVPRDGNGNILSNVFEVEETNTQYLNWIMQLTPEDCQRVDGFAPFLKQIYDALEKNDPWADIATEPFEPEQAESWATRWLELWQGETGDEEIEAVKQDWRDYTELTIQDLYHVTKQAECARQHGILLEFRIS